MLMIQITIVIMTRTLMHHEYSLKSSMVAVLRQSIDPNLWLVLLFLRPTPVIGGNISVTLKQKGVWSLVHQWENVSMMIKSL